MWLVAAICAASLLVISFITRLITKKRWIYLTDCFKRLPYQLIPFILSMSIIVIAINYQGIANKIGDFLNQGPLILTYGTSSYLLSNIINNIPMSILFSNICSNKAAVFASIVGSNIGAFLTPTGALAGIMFTNLVNEHETKYSFIDFVKYGAIISIPIIATTLLVLTVSISF